MRPSTRVLVLACVRHGKGILAAVETWIAAQDALYSTHDGHAGLSAESSATSPSTPPRVISSTIKRE